MRCLCSCKKTATCTVSGNDPKEYKDKEAKPQLTELQFVSRGFSQPLAICPAGPCQMLMCGEKKRRRGVKPLQDFRVSSVSLLSGTLSESIAPAGCQGAPSEVSKDSGRYGICRPCADTDTSLVCERFTFSTCPILFLTS